MTFIFSSYNSTSYKEHSTVYFEKNKLKIYKNILKYS